MELFGRQHSIARKFMLAVVLTTLSALLVACAALMAFDLRHYQTSALEDMHAQADMLAQVTLPAIEFNDAQVATETLSQLRLVPRVQAAAVYGADGSLFTSYRRTDAPPGALPARAPRLGHTVNRDQIRLSVPIGRGGETVGTLYVGADYPLARQVRRLALLLAGVMLACLGLVWLISGRLQRTLTRPILALTDAARDVVRTRDFSRRVQKSTADEVGVLVDAFNTMLGEVGERAASLEHINQQLKHENKERLAAEDALRQLNNTLEERILERSGELQRAHEQLRQSQKLEAVGQLTGGVAHDFNNVLQVVSGNLQLLQMSLASNPEALRRVESAAMAADRGAKLSAQLLAFARRQPLQPVPTDMGRVLRAMDDLLRRVLGESVHIETVVGGGLWATLVDQHQLENVILNLAINARDAMQGEGRLTLELGNATLDETYIAQQSADVMPGQYVMLAISDTGCGMTPEVMARAFEPFFTTKREGEGTGLGLSMVYGFVKQSLGHIRLYSEPGSGTTIRIYLPRSHQPELMVPAVQPATPVGGTETILVVEDDPVVQATVVDTLLGLGYRVLRANDGQAAWTILQSGVPVDLIFTDVVMPGPLRSVDLARQAKEAFPHIEVLFTSGYTQNAIVHGGRLDAGVQLISKPYRRDELARRIRQMLGAPDAGTGSEAEGSRQQAGAATIRPVAEGAMARAEALPASPDDAVSHAGSGRASDAAGTGQDGPSASTTAERVAGGSGVRPASADARGLLSILLVEDNDDGREMLAELLAVLGHDVVGVATAEDALLRLQDRAFDVLLTDVSLPGMDGVELARRVTAGGAAPAIVFLTGYGASAVRHSGIPAKCLSKPVMMEDLQAVLSEIAHAHPA